VNVKHRFLHISDINENVSNIIAIRMFDKQRSVHLPQSVSVQPRCRWSASAPDPSRDYWTPRYLVRYLRKTTCSYSRFIITQQSEK